MKVLNTFKETTNIDITCTQCGFISEKSNVDEIVLVLLVEL